MTERRRFIATAGGVVAAAVATTLVDAPNVIAQPKVHRQVPSKPQLAHSQMMEWTVKQTADPSAGSELVVVAQTQPPSGADKRDLPSHSVLLFGPR